MHTHEEKRTARLEARMTPAVLTLVQHAAYMQGRSVSDFVASAAQAAAESAIERRDIIDLSRADQERFVEALLTPVALNPALERAAEAHRRLIRPA
jgi:uncharacterized protein (DUF1778 family)